MEAGAAAGTGRRGLARAVLVLGQGGRRGPSEALRGSLWRADSILRNPWFLKKKKKKSRHLSAEFFTSPQTSVPLMFMHLSGLLSREWSSGRVFQKHLGTQQDFDFFSFFKALSCASKKKKAPLLLPQSLTFPPLDCVTWAGFRGAKAVWPVPELTGLVTGLTSSDTPDTGSLSPPLRP